MHSLTPLQSWLVPWLKRDYFHKYMSIFFWSMSKCWESCVYLFFYSRDKSVKQSKVNVHLLLIRIEEWHKHTIFGREPRLRPKTFNTYNSPSRAQSQCWFMVGWDTPGKAVHHWWRVLASSRQMNSTYWIFKAGFVTLLYIFSKHKLI